MKITFFLILMLLPHLVFSQKRQEITYKAKNENCQKVNLTLFYRYDTLCEIIDYDVISYKNKDNIFVKELHIPQNLLALGVGFKEVGADINEEGSMEQNGSILMLTSTNDSSTVIKVLGENRESKPAHLQYFCTELDYLQQIEKGNFPNSIHGFFFECLFTKYRFENQGNLMTLFEKYGTTLIYELEAKNDLEAMFSLGVLYGISRDMDKMKNIISKIDAISPTSYLLYLLNDLYSRIYYDKGENTFDDNIVSELAEKCRKYPISPFNDFCKETPNLSYSFGVSLVNALKSHEYYYNASGINSWRRYDKKTSVYYEYKQTDSAYFRYKIMLKNYFSGNMKSYHTFYWEFACSEVSKYEYDRSNFWEALKSISPAYFHYLKNYHKLGFKKINLPFFATLKAKIHLALNEKDSALQVYTELIKLTQADSIFDKIKSTYLEIHDSDSAYKDYLVKNGIDKFHKEIKYAPEASFKIYGTDEMVSLSSLKGKVVVLNFWGTYCKPCVKEMPELNDLKMKFAQDTDVIFIAPTKDNAEKLKSFFKNKKFNYQIAYAANAIFDTFNANFIPVNMVINRKGEIIFEEIGSYHDTLLKLNRAIEEALYAR